MYLNIYILIAICVRAYKKNTHLIPIDQQSYIAKGISQKYIDKNKIELFR